MTAHDDLFEALAELLQRVHQTGESEAMGEFSELDLSFTQVRTLFVLAHEPSPLPISDIAARLGVSAAAAGRTIDRLVRIDLVERHESPDDRRVKLVSSTRRGLDLANRHLEEKRAVLRELAGHLSTSDAQSLTSALRPLLTSKEEHVC